MNRHLPMLLVATLSVGGCHRTELPPKASRSSAPIRSNKEVKPVVISVAPKPPEKAVVIRKSDQGGTAISAPVAKPSLQKGHASRSETVERKLFSDRSKAQQIKGVPEQGPSVKSADVANIKRKSTKDRPLASTLPVEPARGGEKPWERPLDVPSAATGSKTLKTKGAESPKVSSERPMEMSTPVSQVKGSKGKDEKPIAAGTPSTLDSGTALVRVADQSAPSTSSLPAISNPDDARAIRGAVGEKPAESAQKVEQRLEEKSALSPASASPVSAKAVGEVTSEAPPGPAKQENQTDGSGSQGQPQTALSAVPAEAPVANLQTGGEQGGKLAIKTPVKTPIDGPKKLSESERKEEIRRQATESYRSGQQLIRESRNLEAMQAFKQAVKLMPGSADAWLRIAFLLEREGNLEEARRAFREAKKLWSF